jgi:hypothetical protein
MTRAGVARCPLVEPVHDMSSLFAQLGLPADEVSIDAFVDDHCPLGAEVALADAVFWTPSQSTLLAEGVAEDADWAPVIDQLNAMLHSQRRMPQ